jgi:demethylmenaquinone methyltransferase/2-methoxy-6-polyprenyl-1,4-benzoquinol methylase
MIDYYAARATEYDQVYLKPERQADLRAIEGWLPDLFAGKSVLEVACGTGYWTQFLAPRSACIIGVDASVETLQVARTRVPRDKVQLLVGDAYRLPFPPGSFEAAFAGFWWSHVPRSCLGQFLGDLHAALAPDARVVFLDNRFVPGSSTAIAERDADGNTYRTRRLADGSLHRVLKNFPSRKELFAAVDGLACEPRYHAWQHYWALEYTITTR